MISGRIEVNPFKLFNIRSEIWRRSLNDLRMLIGILKKIPMLILKGSFTENRIRTFFKRKSKEYF